VHQVLHCAQHSIHHFRLRSDLQFGLLGVYFDLLFVFFVFFVAECLRFGLSLHVSRMELHCHFLLLLGRDKLQQVVLGFFQLLLQLFALFHYGYSDHVLGGFIHRRVELVIK
jgi:hypothetical protein